jgi:hypothetical protein
MSDEKKIYSKIQSRCLISDATMKKTSDDEIDLLCFFATN